VLEDTKRALAEQTYQLGIRQMFVEACGL